MPDPSVDLVAVARSVGKTKIANCSICHFNGGGGKGVKHGDMDGSMLSPSAEIDVHMGKLAPAEYALKCTDCHNQNNQGRLNWEKLATMTGKVNI